MKKTTKGVLIASAVASMFALSVANAGEEKAGKEASKAVKCAGVNECKGKGWIKVGSEKECKDKGGTLVTAKK